MKIPSVLSALIYGARNRAQGPDVSHHDGSYDPALATQRTDFAFMKLTEGYTWIDPKIDEIWGGVQDVNVRGGYHYQRSGMSWLAQADHFLRIAARYDFHAYILDVEEINNTYSDTFFADARRIVDHWRIKSPGKKVLLYTNVNTYILMYAAMVRLYADGAQWMDSVDLWLAQYWTLWSVDRDPALPPMRRTWQFWQVAYTGRAAEWGTDAATDVNVFNGTPDEMMAWFGLTGPIPEEPDLPTPPEPRVEPVPDAEQWTGTVVATSRVMVRDYPERSDSTFAGLYVSPRERFTGNVWGGNGFLWMKIEFSSRAELLGKWVAVRKADGSDILIRLQRADLSTPQLYRVKHDVELGGVRQVVLESGRGMPEVFRLDPDHHVLLTPELQWLWRRLNPHMTAMKWRTLLGNHLAFTNNGCGFPGHADHVNRLELDKSLPRYDQARVCGGAVLAGIEQGDLLLVETIDTRDPIPSVSEVLSRPWLWFCATTVRPNGTIGRFPQGNGEDVRVPLLSSKPVTYPLRKLVKLPLGSSIPSPYEVP